MVDLLAELTILQERSDIFDSDRYIIPLYQRAFAWEDDEIVQLIEDVKDFEAENYYIGSLIVAKKKDGFEVIDGQQRLTALFLLLSALGIPLKPNLTFECREKSNYTLRHLGNLTIEAQIEESLQKGKQIIEAKLCKEDKEFLKKQLKNVKLYRIEVPEHTNLNRYFEIMNTRGTQLEQHDVLKAKLMSALSSDGDRRRFAEIWDACADMTGYVQMHFPLKLRESLFGDDWNSLKSDFSRLRFEAADEKQNAKTLKDILASAGEPITVEATELEDKFRFESVITFPYLLIHVLKVWIEEKKIRHRNDGESLTPSLLDDKKLLDTFQNVLDNGWSENGSIADRKERFSLDFIDCLLKCRFLFDKYLIKREFGNGDSIGEWSLKELKVSGFAKKKQPYYANSKFSKKYEREGTFLPRTKINLMLQSCLRVSYTSPKAMHWITDLLKWLYRDENLTRLDMFGEEIERIAKIAVKTEYFDMLSTDGADPPNKLYNWGVRTPHLVFNYLDYLLWRYYGNKEFEDFVFEFRNSVEHWYPRHPSEGTFEKWTDGVDTFGNVCMIQRNVNSKFSNLSPEAKKSTFDEMIKKGSLKLRIMAKMTCDSENTNANQAWKDKDCATHEEEMIRYLRDACYGNFDEVTG